MLVHIIDEPIALSFRLLAAMQWDGWEQDPKHSLRFHKITGALTQTLNLVTFRDLPTSVTEFLFRTRDYYALRRDMRRYGTEKELRSPTHKLLYLFLFKPRKDCQGTIDFLIELHRDHLCLLNDATPEELNRFSDPNRIHVISITRNLDFISSDSLYQCRVELSSLDELGQRLACLQTEVSEFISSKD